MKRPQWITVAAALALTGVLYFFGRTVPAKKPIASTATEQHSPDDGHDHGGISIDSILLLAKKQLKPEQAAALGKLETAAAKEKVAEEQAHLYHLLARYWADTARIFEPYAWYTAEAARLENSEKSLTFAAHLFLENLQTDGAEQRRQWKALQAKDLFERSLKINPGNDSSKVGLGACYLFGNISSNPLEGIAKIKEVVDRDSTNTYGQLTLAKGSLLSGQYDKAISRLLTVTRLQPGNVEVLLLLADTYERTGDKKSAVSWYRQCLGLVKEAELKKALQQRIDELTK
ncbi:MAG TPA: tetratricopeptide repeat protein [Chitinophagaceae bacterium]|nr:tetratricopeptide repeat protein [Chitinophagaceae bacterium]